MFLCLGNVALQSVKIATKVLSIGKATFQLNNALTTLDLPTSVTFIDQVSKSFCIS